MWKFVKYYKKIFHFLYIDLGRLDRHYSVVQIEWIEYSQTGLNVSVFHELLRQYLQCGLLVLILF